VKNKVCRRLSLDFHRDGDDKQQPIISTVYHEIVTYITVMLIKAIEHEYHLIVKHHIILSVLSKY